MSGETECQPCDGFRNGMGDFNVHECFAPFGEPGTPKCGGTVRFCSNCNRDHHDGGYQTCKGMRSCRRKHPACLAILAKRSTEDRNHTASQHVDEGLGEEEGRSYE